MVKIASFTQTYGDKRKELYDLKEYDVPDMTFRRLCDKNYYSFHNCPDEVVQYVTKTKWFSAAPYIVLRYDNITYPMSLFRTLLTAKQDGVDYLVFLQDDVFATAKPECYAELMQWCRSNEFNMINLEATADELKCDDQPLLMKGEHLDVYKCTNHLAVSRNPSRWAFDDAPYIAKLDFLLREVYDYTYYQYPDVWRAEHVLNSKMMHKLIERNLVSKKLFHRTNLVGMNTWNRINMWKEVHEWLGLYGFPPRAPEDQEK